jgi:hypothetical protein
MNMNQLLTWLAEGNLASDGLANEVVRLVSADLDLLPDLVEGLHASDAALRGHTADALEKLARSYPEAVLRFLPDLTRAATQDRVPMVRWHMAMTLGHLSVFPDRVPELADTLFFLLQDGSVSARCWAIVSLCILARQYPQLVERSVAAIVPLSDSASAALRAKVGAALPLLTNPGAPFPKGWVKSRRLQHLYERNADGI